MLVFCQGLVISTCIWGGIRGQSGQMNTTNSENGERPSPATHTEASQSFEGGTVTIDNETGAIINIDISEVKTQAPQPFSPRELGRKNAIHNARNEIKQAVNQ